MKKNVFIRWIRKHSLITPIFPIVVLAAIGVYWYLNNFQFPIINQLIDYVRVDLMKSQSGNKAAETGYICDGRTTCAQMTSCNEAKFFLNNCPTENMDGDLDNIPCEIEWCVR